MTDFSQPGIINALDYGLVPNNQTPSVMLANTQALTNAINAAQAACAGGASYGGSVIIPSNDAVPNGTIGDGGVYYFSTADLGTPAITITCSYPILILGTGNGTELVMAADTDLFEINNAGSGGASAGVTFQDLEISYTPGAAIGAAIRVIDGSQNVRLFRVVLRECPVGVALDKSLQFSMIDCVIWNEQNPGNAVTLGIATSDNNAKETYIAGCLFEASKPNNGMGTGLTIVNTDEVRVVNTRIQGYAQGIVVNPAVGYCVHLFFENVTAVPFLTSSSPTGGAALLIQPTSGGTALQAVFVGCEFGQTDNDTLYTGPGVLIDQTQTTGFVDQLRFVSCWSSGWPGNGMQINGEVNQVEIIGGSYSCNGQSSDAPAPAIGIDITNPASGTHSGTRIIGVACNNSIYNNEGDDYLSASQDIGVSIASGAKNISVRQCDLTNNNTAALRAASPDPTIEVTDSTGYNDKATLLATAPPENDETFSATQTYGHCGPIAFYVSGGDVGNILINNNPTGLSAGGFTLSPGETAELQYSSSPAFYAVGK